MTESEQVAAEHLVYRRHCKWPWRDIASEADDCCRSARKAEIAALHPYKSAPEWAVIRAYAMAYEAMQMGRVSA